MIAFSKGFTVILFFPFALLCSELIQVNLPISTNELFGNPKNLANYLFCDNFPLENSVFGDLFPRLTVPQYIKALHSLRPEH